MAWRQHILAFLGGAFFANAMPHWVMGASGQPFQSPFASPAGVGLSSALVNVVWGSSNLVIAYLFLFVFSSFEVPNRMLAACFGLGFLSPGFCGSGPLRRCMAVSWQAARQFFLESHLLDILRAPRSEVSHETFSPKGAYMKKRTWTFVEALLFWVCCSCGSVTDAPSVLMPVAT